MDPIPLGTRRGLSVLAWLTSLGLIPFTAVHGQQVAPKAAVSSPSQDGLGKAKLAEKPIHVLGGRLLVRVPQGAEVQARSHDIMSAPESEEHETRVVFNSGTERLVLMVHETFAFAGVDLEKDVREWVVKWQGQYRIESFPLLAKGLKAVAVIPVNDPDHRRSDDATFVQGLFVESHDRTIQSLDVYVNAAGEKDLKGCKAVAREILSSVAPGAKTLKLGVGERRLSTGTKDREIAVTVPMNMVATKQIGPDFLVHRLIAVGRLGHDVGSIGIYVGDHPNFQPRAKTLESMLFGKKVEWHVSAQGEGLETLCELPIPGELHLYAHVWISAPDAARLKVLREAAETMKLVKPLDSRPK